MFTWKEKIRQGNESFNKKEWALAERAYLAAARDLEQEWFGNLENIHLMMAWLANMHNLSTLYETTGHSQQSGHYLVLAYRRISILIKENVMPTGIQQYLHMAMRRALVPLLEYATRYPVCSCCQDELVRMKNWLAQPDTPMPDLATDKMTSMSYGAFNQQKQISANMTIH